MSKTVYQALLPANDLPPLQRLAAQRFEEPTLLKALIEAHKQLALLKGMVTAMPNQHILINTLGLQEAKDSSEIENIVTTHDELFRHASVEQAGPA